jgi:hypothetical protein
MTFPDAEYVDGAAFFTSENVGVGVGFPTGF